MLSAILRTLPLALAKIQGVGDDRGIWKKLFCIGRQQPGRMGQNGAAYLEWAADDNVLSLQWDKANGGRRGAFPAKQSLGTRTLKAVSLSLDRRGRLSYMFFTILSPS